MKKNKSVNTIMISILGFICVFIGVFFSSILIVGLLPFLLILIGVLKIYDLNEDCSHNKH